MRLNKDSALSAEIRPHYFPEAHGIGIVHLGLGAFSKAHIADYTDRALGTSGGDWRIIGVSLRNQAPATALTPQDGRYTLLTRSVFGTKARVIGALAGAICAAGNSETALAEMANVRCRIVSLTVTEKAYGLDRAKMGCDISHPAVAADLINPSPQGVLGLLTRALAMRRAAGIAPFTVLCCDNLPKNGTLLRGAVVDFARHIEADLSDWIAQNVAFPATMVDRITPVALDTTYAEAVAITGFVDLAAVETEEFSQWVIEDHFPLGRPDWTGAIFVPNAAPYEAMKLRMLNGTHSMLAYAGYHAGMTYVRDVMADLGAVALVSRHLHAAARTLPDMQQINLIDYANSLQARFANPAIAHQTYQIAMDGTEKLPQRIFAPALDALDRGQSLRPFAFATAAWMRHVSRSTHDCPSYDLRDPRADEIGATLAGRTNANSIATQLMMLPNFMPDRLILAEGWTEAIHDFLQRMLTQPMQAVIRAEAALSCGS